MGANGTSWHAARPGTPRAPGSGRRGARPEGPGARFAQARGPEGRPALGIGPGRGLGGPAPPCPPPPLTLAVVLHELQDGDGPGGPPQEAGDGVHHPLHVVLLLGRHGRRRGRYGNRRHGAGPAGREPPSRHSREPGAPGSGWGTWPAPGGTWWRRSGWPSPLHPRPPDARVLRSTENRKLGSYGVC